MPGVDGSTSNIINRWVTGVWFNGNGYGSKSTIQRRWHTKWTTQIIWSQFSMSTNRWERVCIINFAQEACIYHLRAKLNGWRVDKQSNIIMSVMDSAKQNKKQNSWLQFKWCNFLSHFSCLYVICSGHKFNEFAKEKLAAELLFGQLNGAESSEHIKNVLRYNLLTGPPSNHQQKMMRFSFAVLGKRSIRLNVTSQFQWMNYLYKQRNYNMSKTDATAQW